MASVQPDLGGVLEPVAGRFGGGHDNALHHDLPVEHRHDLGGFLDRGSDCAGKTKRYISLRQTREHNRSLKCTSKIYFRSLYLFLYTCNVFTNSTTSNTTFDIEVQVGIKLSKFVLNVALVNATVSRLWLLQEKEVG